MSCVARINNRVGGHIAGETVALSWHDALARLPTGSESHGSAAPQRPQPHVSREGDERARARVRAAEGTPLRAAASVGTDAGGERKGRNVRFSMLHPLCSDRIPLRATVSPIANGRSPTKSHSLITCGARRGQASARACPRAKPYAPLSAAWRLASTLPPAPPRPRVRLLIRPELASEI